MLRMPFECEAAPTRNVQQVGSTLQAVDSEPTIQVVLVGAGGTGARVAALLPRILLGNQHRITIVDHDTVETRNLLRQHFHPNDVGMNKAQVVAQRMTQAYLDETSRPVISFVPMKIRHAQQNGYGDHFARTLHRVIYIGCVDNPEARRDLYALHKQYTQSAYIDAGNATRHGQVVLSLHGFPVVIGSAFLKSSKYTRDWVGVSDHRLITYDGVVRHAPTLLEVPPEDGPEDCALRLDTQTVAANQMAATIVGSVLSAIVDRLPMNTAYYEFGTNPPSVTAVPFNRASSFALARSGDPWALTSGSR